MRKAERLFQIVTLLRNRRLAITAMALGEMLEVSERTIYRDIQALIQSGVPIEGEAGIGYQLHQGFHLPPLMFNTEELLALVLGANMVQAWTDPALAKSATSAIEKIVAVMPDKLKKSTQAQESLVVPNFFINRSDGEIRKVLREAINARQLVSITYADESKKQTQRNVEPLGLVFWGNKWTLICFCRLRQEYRVFRVDRILDLKLVDENFELLPEKSLKHYLAKEC